MEKMNKSKDFAVFSKRREEILERNAVEVSLLNTHLKRNMKVLDIELNVFHGHDKGKRFTNNYIKQKLKKELLIANTYTVANPSRREMAIMRIRTMMIQIENTLLTPSAMMSMIWFELIALPTQ